MSYYYTCEYCDANLDPGEQCDCEESVKQKLRDKRKEIRRTMEEMENELIRD